MRSTATATAQELQPAPRKSRPRPELWHAGPRESEIRFSLRHLIVAKISGRVGRWRASFVIDLNQPSRSSIEVVIDAGSLESGAPERDQLRRVRRTSSTSGVFPKFDSLAAPYARAATGACRSPATSRIRDVTREVEVEVERTPAVAVRSQVSKLVFKGHVSIRREDFGLHWPGEPALLAGATSTSISRSTPAAGRNNTEDDHGEHCG